LERTPLRAALTGAKNAPRGVIEQSLGKSEKRRNPSVAAFLCKRARRARILPGVHRPAAKCLSVGL